MDKMKFARTNILMIFVLFLLKGNSCVLAMESKKMPLLSKNARVSVITCAPGEEIYSVFGHTALRIDDSESKIDNIYNYGTFDFAVDNFALKFARGNLMYFASVNSFRDFILAYQMENRAVSEQVINLDSAQKQVLYNLVETNLNSPEKYYRYQFFADNCTTRIYHLLTDVVGRGFETDTLGIYKRRSYRELFTPYVENFPWLCLGMNIGLGLEADKKANYEQSLFLPLNLELALSRSSNNGLPLVLQTNKILNSTPALEKSVSWFMPINVFVGLLFLISILTALQIIFRFQLVIIDVFLFGLVGLFGCVILLLSLFSLHIPTHYNINVLWLMPFNLFFIFNLSKNSKLIDFYLRFYLFLLFVLGVLNLFFHLFVQEFYVIALVLIIRLVYLLWIRLSVTTPDVIKTPLKTSR